MATITFKTKAVKLHDGDQVVDTFKIPSLTRNHCDMHGFRTHKNHRISGLSNSDLFLGMINRMVKDMYPNGWIRADRLNEVTSLKSGFLTEITIDIV